MHTVYRGDINGDLVRFILSEQETNANKEGNGQSIGGEEGSHMGHFLFAFQWRSFIPFTFCVTFVVVCHESFDIVSAGSF